MCSAFIRVYIPDEEEPWCPQEFDDERMYLDYSTPSYSATSAKKLLTWDEALDRAIAVARQHATEFPELRDRIVVQDWYYCHGDEPGRRLDVRV